LLELADEQFIGIRESIGEYQRQVSQRIVQEPQAVAINKDSLRQYAQSGDYIQRLDQSIAVLLGFKVEFDEESIARDVEALQFVGISTIAQLERALADNFDSIIALAQRFAEKREGHEPKFEVAFGGISNFYLCYILLAKTEDPTHITKYMNKFSIGLERVNFAKEMVEWYSKRK